MLSFRSLREEKEKASTQGGAGQEQGTHNGDRAALQARRPLSARENESNSREWGHAEAGGGKWSPQSDGPWGWRLQEAQVLQNLRLVTCDL